MGSQVLERFHRALIEEIQTQRPDYLTASFTVAEIYQNLVPYSSHRDRIGVEMNGDYEDALVRLLAGEGGYLILDSEPALRDLRAELESTHPNTGIYREFAAVDVRLNQAYLDLSAAALDQLPDLVRELEAENPVTMADLAPSEETAGLGIVPPGVDIFATAPRVEGIRPPASPPSSAAGAPKGASRPSTAGAAAASASGGSVAGSGGGASKSGAAASHGGTGPPKSGAGVPKSAVSAPEPTSQGAGSRGSKSGSPSSKPTASASGDPGEIELPVPAAHRPPLAPEFVDEPGPTRPAADSGCRSCGSRLPDRDEVNFCPFCGVDLRVIACGSCGTTLDPAWQYCPTCGTQAIA